MNTTDPFVVERLVADRIASLHDTAALVHHRNPLRPPHPGSSRFSRWAADLGHRIADGGIEAHERRVAAVVRLARRQGYDHAAVAVLADRNGPAVARERALGIVLSALAHGRGRSASGDARVA